MRIDREKRFEFRHEYENIPHKQDVALQRVEMIDENGEIHSEIQEVVIDESEQIAKIPAYTTKIEYIQKYGTLDTNDVIKFTKSNPSFNNMDVREIAKMIVEQNKSEE